MREEKCKENDNKKSSKKPVAMSLQAFNNMDLNGATPNESPECDMNEKFYADVDEATKIAMNREQIRESLEQRYSVSVRWNLNVLEMSQMFKRGSMNYVDKQGGRG